MQLIYHNAFDILIMMALLVCWIFFSGAETAFFNLSGRQINDFKSSAGKLQKLVVYLLKEPGNLLSCLLFGNMIISVMFSAFASMFTLDVSKRYGGSAAVISAAAFFCICLLFGDILPKSIAYFNTRKVSILAAAPAYFFLRFFMPIVFVLKFFIVEPSLRIILGHAKKSKTITIDEFLALIKQAGKRGFITDDQGKLINEIVELGSLKVRDCLRPRVDMVVCSAADSAESIRQIMRKHRLTSLAVYSKKIDNIVGMIYLRQILLNPEKPIEQILSPVYFVPEQKSIESLLDFFRKTKTDTALAVNEYGGIEGYISIEDVVEELLGPVKVSGRPKPIEAIGPFEYRLAGNLPIHDWASAFDIDVKQTRITTIGGFVTILLGKIPQPGDTANIGNIKFTVESVRRHRIETVIFRLEQIKEND